MVKNVYLYYFFLVVVFIISCRESNIEMVENKSDEMPKLGFHNFVSSNNGNSFNYNDKNIDKFSYVSFINEYKPIETPSQLLNNNFKESNFSLLAVDEHQIDTLNYINLYRYLAGLQSIVLEPQINDVAALHADYYLNNLYNLPSSRETPHIEINNFDQYYRGETVGDRFDSEGINRFNNWVYEGIVFADSSKEAIHKLVNSIYHRIPIFQPNLHEIGCVSAKVNYSDKDEIIHIIDYISPAKKGKIVGFYPMNNQEDFPTTFIPSTEDPNPLPYDENDAVGSPISVHFQLDKVPGKITNIECSLLDQYQNSIPYYIITSSEDNKLQSEIFVVAKEPYNKNSFYMISLKATYGDVTFNRSWSFKTGNK